jgi:hypothetical protein
MVLARCLSVGLLLCLADVALTTRTVLRILPMRHELRKQRASSRSITCDLMRTYKLETPTSTVKHRKKLTMPPKTRSSDTGLQRIIQEVDDLQLPESAKGYFTEVSQFVFVMPPESDILQLLKHIDARDQQWTKVVKLWEHYESHSKSFNKAMIEIMQNMQEIFMKDDDFFKHLYKERMEEVGASLKDDSA